MMKERFYLPPRRRPEKPPWRLDDDISAVTKTEPLPHYGHSTSLKVNPAQLNEPGRLKKSVVGKVLPAYFER